MPFTPLGRIVRMGRRTPTGFDRERSDFRFIWKDEAGGGVAPGGVGHMIASLMMYARPEMADAQARFWTLIRRELAARGVDTPEELANEAEEFAVWRDPALVLSQTCGMPYRMWLKDKVSLIGTPDYGLEGCAPGYYRSPFIVRRDDTRADVAGFEGARFAYNMTHSQSGYAAPYAHVSPLGFWFEQRVQSGGHRASAQMVARGEADIAALDAVTWRLIQRYDDFAGDLRVLAWTVPSPGLPLITAKGADRGAIFAGVEAATRALGGEDRATLCLRGLVDIPSAAYLTVPNPPADMM